MRTNRPFFPVLLSLALVTSAAAAADPPGGDKKALAQAKAGEALAYFDKGEWRPALDAFRAAEQLVHAPTLVLYMARCEERLGKMLEARALYEKVVAEPVPKDAPEAYAKGHAGAMSELAELRLKIPSLSVKVVGATGAGARVTIDATDVPAGQERELDPGEHKVVVTTPGVAPVARTVTLAPGRSIEIAVPVDAPAVLAPVSTQAAPAPPRWPAALAGGAFGIGIAGVATGAVAAVMTLGRVSSLNEACPKSTCPSNAYSGAVSGAKSLHTLTITGFALGGAGVLAGALILGLGPRGAPPPRVTTALRVGLGQLGLEGSF